MALLQGKSQQKKETLIKQLNGIAKFTGMIVAHSARELGATESEKRRAGKLLNGMMERK